MDVALAWGDVAYLDCDVEGPNGHIFLEPRITETREVTVPVPRVDTGLCRHHGRCAEFCRYNAIAVLPTGWVLFDELCASCGGCSLACPEGAIREVRRRVGTLARGTLPGGAPFAEGALHTGEARAVPVIREVLREAPTDGDTILDSPPGASCPTLAVVEAAEGHARGVPLIVSRPPGSTRRQGSSWPDPARPRAVWTGSRPPPRGPGPWPAPAPRST